MRRRVVFLVPFLLGGCASAPPVLAQQPMPGGPDPLVTAAVGLEWREIGPTIMGGRISDIAVVESDPRIFYVGTATGGVWKTVNAGITFEPVFSDQETASIGDVTVAPSNPNVVWVGTGEPQNRQSSPWGHGVYRSTDAGRTWTHLGLESTHHIARIEVHPSDPDVAYVAAVGHLWGSNPERGVYRTTDGGRSWEHVLSGDANTGAIDLAMDPNDPRTLFAAMYQRQRRAWGFNGGGPGSGIYRTYDGGDTWTERTEGLPGGDKGRIGLSIYHGDGNLVCALVQADADAPGDGFGGGDEEDVEDGVYCSTDRGETWEHRSTTNNRPMYYSQIRIDPNDPERIYLGGSDLFRSSDGGRTFTDDGAADVHLDHHALWIDPSDSDHLLLGSDGGLSVSWDRSDHWYQFRNLPLAQFYEIGADMREPYHVCGGLQDNGSWCAPSQTWSDQGVRTRDWYNVGSGDGFFTVMHPEDPTVMFAESQGGNLTRVNLATMERSRIRPIGRPAADADTLPDLRWNWNSPIVMSAHDPSTIYAGANVLFRSTDLGQSWEAISPDLTWAIDREQLSIMGVPGSAPQMSLNDGQSTYGNLTAIAESPVDADLVYTGADDGRLQVTRDGGATWTDVTGNVPGLPPNTYVTRIVASHADAGTVWAAFDGHRSDDFAPYVYASSDFGGTWRPIVGGLPHTSVNALAQHPQTPNLLFAGNEVGAYVSFDAGGRWLPVGHGLPTVPVDDIEIHPRDNDLLLGTHGRGIWILEDVGPLEQLVQPDVLASAAYLFPIRRATSLNEYEPQGWTPGIWEAENPPQGARIRYWLSGPVDSVTVTVTDDMGSPLRELEASGDAGFHEVVWDLRLTEEDARGEPMDPGPRVLPGIYLVQLNAGDDVAESDVTIRLDPRVTMSRADLMARQEAMLESYRLSGPVDQAEDALDDLDDRLAEVEAMLEGADGGGHEALAEAVAVFREDVEALAEALDDSGDGAGVWNQIQSASAPPTADQLYLIERAWERVPPLIERVNAMVETRMPQLYRDLNQAGVVPALPERVPLPRRGGR